jgi:hypothetical protein
MVLANTSTLESPKIVAMEYNFLHFKILTCVHQTWWQSWKLWGDLRSLEFNLINFLQKNSTKDENFVGDEYIWVIHVIEYEKWEIYFKSEVICDIFV